MVQPQALTFLLDTNEVIALEPFAGKLEPLQESLAQLLTMARDNGHRVVVHPANRDDLRETPDNAHRQQNLAALKKYEELGEVPISPELEGSAGPSAEGSNDWRDLRLLAAVAAGAATHLVTEDARLRKRATRAGLQNQVIRAADALELLRQLHPSDPPTPPAVERFEAASLDLNEPIFASLRADYPGFDDWIRKAASQGNARRTWVVRDVQGGYRAIAIVKLQDDHPLIPGGKATKLSTFKVDAQSEGEKLGELLLKTVLTWAHEVHVETLFVTVLNDESKKSLMYFLEMFGFFIEGRLPSNANEFVFTKRFTPDDTVELSALDHHIAYGPPALALTAGVYLVPIVPRWYEALFPDAPFVGEHGQATLGGLLAETKPFGNALRKAYLCNATTKSIPPGSTILFYRSAGAGGGGSVHAVGVIESTKRSDDPKEIVTFVGRRTVYTAADVASMCEDGARGKKEVLAMLFRQDRFISKPWTLPMLKNAGVVKGPPQSVMQVRTQEGIAWVHQQLAE